MNMLQYMPENNAWMKRYADCMGWDELAKYYDKVWLMLYDMRPGHTFRVLDEVHPKNYDLFMKCVDTALEELNAYGIHSYYIEEQGTVILRR